MGLLEGKWPRRCVPHLGARPTYWEVDVNESSAHPAHPPTEDHDDAVEAHYASLERPHACTDGVVYIGHLAEDPGSGEEAEVLEAVPCRRCAGEDH
jgi:hypothetical protein